jgi:hypothetical protein
MKTLAKVINVLVWLFLIYAGYVVLVAYMTIGTPSYGNQFIRDAERESYVRGLTAIRWGTALSCLWFGGKFLLYLRQKRPERRDKAAILQHLSSSPSSEPTDRIEDTYPWERS